jgi:uracil-DNA glycosylase
MRRLTLDSLDLLTQMKNCTRCHLRETCAQVVTGVGDFSSPLLIVGEAPGADEDLEGEPFVGRSGQLLTKLLADAGIERSATYVSNAVKCRPPGNRTPSPEEIAVCKIWLWREIQQLSNLKVILPLGAIPTGLLLKLKSTTMSHLVGRTFKMDFTKAKIMPWYHPSYLLRRNKPTKDNEGVKLIDRTIAWFKTIKESL